MIQLRDPIPEGTGPGRRGDRWRGPRRSRPRRPSRARPVASRTQVSGSVSTTLGGVPRVCTGPGRHWTAATGGTRTSSTRPGCRVASRASRYLAASRSSPRSGAAPPSSARSTEATSCGPRGSGRRAGMPATRDQPNSAGSAAPCTAASSASGIAKQSSTTRASPPGPADGLARHAVRFAQRVEVSQNTGPHGHHGPRGRLAEQGRERVAGQPDPAAGPAAQAGFGERDGQPAVGQVVRRGQQPGRGRRGQQPGQPLLGGQVGGRRPAAEVAVHHVRPGRTPELGPGPAEQHELRVRARRTRSRAAAARRRARPAPR